MIFGGLNSAGALLARNTRNFPNDIGLIFGEKRLTWAKVNSRANAFVSSLKKLGIKQGDRVAIYAKNSHHIIKQLNNANADHLTQELMALVSLSQTYVMAQTKFIIH